MIRSAWSVLLLAFVGAMAFHVSGSAAARVPLTAGLKLDHSERIQPGDYRLSDSGGGIVQISGEDYTLDFKGVTLTGDGKGIGLHLVGAKNITIKNATVTGCRWGIVLERCEGVKLIDCVSSKNADLEPGTVIDESGERPEDQHGGGILLRDSHNCKVIRCVAQHQWDGIDIVRSNGNVIEDGDYSYNGNWGVHFWGSSKNVFRNNRAIWCTTGSGTLFQALTGWQTYDAQGVGIDHASCDNLIEGNDLRFGGDGIFIRANEGGVTPGTQVPAKNSSDRNILRNNDCSFSPNNAIEVDFVADTIIEGNNCSYSNYGIWLGYSLRSIVRNNTCINDSARAVEIENGQGSVFENNVFGWTEPRPNSALVYLRKNKRDATPSGPYTLRDNVFFGAGKAVELLKTRKTELKGNVLLLGALKHVEAVTADADSVVRIGDSAPTPPEPSPTPLVRVPKRLQEGTDASLLGRDLKVGEITPVVELDGIPAWVVSSSASRIRFKMPSDFWDRPQVSTAKLRVFNGRAWSEPATVAVEWQPSSPRLTSVSPNPGSLGQTVTVTGENLGSEGKLILEGKPVPFKREDVNRLTFQPPPGLLIPKRFNLLYSTGEGLQERWTPPIPWSIRFPNEVMPHLLSAKFSPTTLKTGELLKIEYTLRNNLPYAAPLQSSPKPPKTWDEREAYFESGIEEQRGTLHLRATSDKPGEHHPGSWPWMFGFDQKELAPGEKMTVTGYVRVRTPGTYGFRVGLVVGGDRFIDDNAFPAKITVLP